MGAPAVAFAVVQLIAVLVKGGLQIKRKTDESAEASRISAFVSNTSSTDFDVECYEPNHGKWLKKPDGYLAGVTSAIHNCEAEARKALGDDAAEAAIDAWIISHIDEHHADEVNDNYLEFGGEGSGGGTELAILLTEKGDADSRIVLMIRKRPGGLYGAGISMSNGPWFMDNHMDRTSDPDGSEISDHIQEVTTDVCKFSSGETVGKEITTRLNGIKVVTKAQKVALFEISDD